ncbi:MAG: hypothetical protein A3G81_21735 [Betaproteobacteria bacterium RIFCSPLOWO2_12_FULL_65_14]|nr:MAG: hypothetical protein A3G81_21735 [Betaproteobacteria bacterium RIFCSPLOWO2_12_FULL_65_14]
MLSRTISRLVLSVALALAASAFAQSGLRLPERGEPGLDPAFARGWLAPDFDRFGFAHYHWKEAIGFAPSQRMNWSYSFGERGSLGMSLGARDFEYDQRHLSLFGRYWFAPDWALSAEATSRESTGLLRLNDWRIGVQRRF